MCAYGQYGEYCRPVRISCIPLIMKPGMILSWALCWSIVHRFPVENLAYPRKCPITPKVAILVSAGFYRHIVCGIGFCVNSDGNFFEFSTDTNVSWKSSLSAS